MTDKRKPRIIEVLTQQQKRGFSMEQSSTCIKFTSNQKKGKGDLDTPLSEYSPKDKKWDRDRAVTQEMSDFLTHIERFERWAERMDGCTRSLGFGEVVDRETGEIKPKLVNAFFCHCRHCQTCDGRKSLVRMGRFKTQLPTIEEQYPKARWILLTLTVPNCPVNELRSVLGDMNKAWQRLSQRKAFKPVLGWIRATEVTQEKKRKDYAHPHFHVLLLVPPSMISGVNYIKHADWLQLWRDCYRDQSIQMVNVKAVKGGTMKGAVETLKAFNYSMKVDELIKRTPAWILEYMDQVHSLRFISTGGVLKDVLKDVEGDLTDQDMIHVDENGDIQEEGASEVVRVATWRPSEKIYRMKK